MATRKRTHKILRSTVTAQELAQWHLWPPFDAAVVNIQHENPAHIAMVNDMVAGGKQYFRYYSVFEYPFNATLFGGTSPPLATWFNYLRDNLQFLTGFSHRRMRGDAGDANKVALFFAYLTSGQRREIIPWKVITNAERDAMAQKMVDEAFAPGGTAIPCSGVFLDQAWLTHENWMYDQDAGVDNDPYPDGISGHGETPESAGFPRLNFAPSQTKFGTPSNNWNDHQTSIEDFFSKLDAKLAPLGAYAIRNGEHRTKNSRKMAKPWYFEKAWNNNIDVSLGGWNFVQTEYLTDPRNVLSTQLEAVNYADTVGTTGGIHEILQYWKEKGGWISCTDGGTAESIRNREMFYRDAAMIQGGAI